MATLRANPRLQVGSASWIAEERSTALQIAEAETEEFTFSARNEVEWLNEHMAEIFSENQINVADIFKTPGKLRGKTPRTARRHNPLEARAPLSDVFSATPRGEPSPFRQAQYERPVSTFQVAEDEPEPERKETQAEPIQLETEASMPKPAPNNLVDSGYFGSQRNDATQATQATQPNEPTDMHPSPKASPPKRQAIPVKEVSPASTESEERRTTEGSFQSAKEEQTRIVMEETLQEQVSPKRSTELKKIAAPVFNSPVQARTHGPAAPQKKSPEKLAEVSKSPFKPTTVEEPAPVIEDEHMEDVQSPSDGSSPIRPIVRKSSLNFASLPAREPITTKKSIGNRVSRTSHLEQPRTSYYGRTTGGKSLGNVRQENQHDADDDDMDLDEPNHDDTDGDAKISRLHNKTSTQRLQDQISMLGKSQSNNRPASKSTANNGPLTAPVNQPSHAPAAPTAPEVPQHRSPQHRSPQHKSPQRRPFAAPGAFPDDEDDSWIGPPTAAAAEPSIFSPRPQMSKSHSTDVMEGIHGKDSIGGAQFSIPKRGEEHRQKSPVREPVIPERTTSTLGHMKSASTSVLRSPKKAGESPEHKLISVSNPNPSTGSCEATTPPKSPSRSYKGSPLKAAKDKFSSILKTSRGLFASSAAVSAEAKTSTMSPASNRMGLTSQPSFEDVLQGSQAYQSQEKQYKSQQSLRAPNSPGKASARKTRASSEREERKKEEQAREAREAKETQKMTDQLEKARQKVKEEARVYRLEQERVAAMQKEVIARKEQEKQAKASQVSVAQPTRKSPRKTKAQLEAEGIAAAAASTDELSSKDIEMSDVSSMAPPPRPKSQIGRPPAKRPLKPAKEPATKAKPPTVIRVDTGSQRGHQYHPSNSTLAATLQESLGAQTAGSSQGLRNKASISSIQSKASTSSFKSAATKALEAAARKKEQDELAAQKKREAKQEIDRQRAAVKEEERRKEEQTRRQEAERQRTLQREREQAANVADAKKTAQRQAIEKRRLEMEKAKQTGAPPPAIRPQPSGDLTHSMPQEKPLPQVPQGMGQAKANLASSAIHRSQEEGRPLNSMLHNTAKIPPKRPLQQDAGDDHHSRPTMQRNPPSYQHNDNHSKRRKTSENFDDDDDMTEPQPKMTAPPIRQSSSRPKDMQTKSIFPSGYGNAPPPGSLQRATLIAQHNQSKPAHPLDMAQVSKAPIPFASSNNQGNSQHKTPARPGQAHGGKSAAKSAKSSPRYQNGENIELPEIHTDSEDEEEDAGDFVAAGWTNSPDLRKQLAKQETIDPAEVFGQPGPLNMEEVFSKSKDRWHKFRARTSSANWSGQDRLTEDEVRRDLEARDRVRRQGGWTYDSMV